MFLTDTPRFSGGGGGFWESKKARQDSAYNCFVFSVKLMGPCPLALSLFPGPGSKPTRIVANKKGGHGEQCGGGGGVKQWGVLTPMGDVIGECNPSGTTTLPSTPLPPHITSGQVLSHLAPHRAANLQHRKSDQSGVRFQGCHSFHKLTVVALNTFCAHACFYIIYQKGLGMDELYARNVVSFFGHLQKFQANRGATKDRESAGRTRWRFTHTHTRKP